MLLFVHTQTTESKQVKVQTSRIVNDRTPENGENDNCKMKNHQNFYKQITKKLTNK